MLTSYLGRTRALEKQPDEFFLDSVDHGANPWSPIWVRLIDRLETLSTTGKLPSEAHERIQAAYQQYKSGGKGVDARREKHAKEMEEFNTIFAGNQYKALRERLVRPETGLFSHKHAGCFVLETPVFEKRLEFLKLYRTALQTQPTLDLSKKLVSYLEKHIRDYSKVYQTDVPEEVRVICEQGIAAFRKLSKGF